MTNEKGWKKAAETECRSLPGFEVIQQFIASTRWYETYYGAAHSFFILTFRSQVGKADIGTRFLQGRVGAGSGIQVEPLSTYFIVIIVTSIPQYATLREVAWIDLHYTRASSIAIREGRILNLGPDTLIERCAISRKENMCDSRGLLRKRL